MGAGRWHQGGALDTGQCNWDWKRSSHANYNARAYHYKYVNRDAECHAHNYIHTHKHSDLHAHLHHYANRHSSAAVL